MFYAVFHRRGFALGRADRHHGYKELQRSSSAFPPSPILMTITRRTFHQIAFGSAASAAFSLAAPCSFAVAAQDRAALPFQPFSAEIERLLAALASLGTPLPASDIARLQEALKASGTRSELERVKAIEATLDEHVLLEVELNPEMRLAAHRGPARAELFQGGWRSFLVKIHNNAGTTTGFAIKSPQSGSVGRRSSLAITGVHDFTNGAVDLVESRNRWLAISNTNPPPLTTALSGLSLEYRIVQLYSRDSGQREASLQADAGWGEQDLGYRSSVPVLFQCLPAQAVGLQIRDERGQPSIASLLITDGLGRVYPAQTKRSAPDLNFQPHIYRYNGESLLLPGGEYTVEYSRGPEYLTDRKPLHIAASGAPATLAVALRRWVTPSDHGYYSGDTHIHAAGCSHYESPTEGVTPLVMARQSEGEALDLGSVLNWGPGFQYQKQFFSGHALNAAPVAPHAAHTQTELPAGMPHDAQALAAEEDATTVATVQHDANAAGARSLLRYDVEVSGFPSSHCGHLVLLQLSDDRYPGSHSIDDWPSWNVPILRWAKGQGAVVGYAHSAHGLVVDNTSLPNLVVPPFNSMGANEFIADVTQPGLVDFISGCDLWPFAELNIWYHTLNCGFRTAFAGETDFPCLTDACVGGGRSYAALPSAPQGDTGYAAWLRSLLYGSSYFGDGRSHLFDFRVNGHLRGEADVTLPAASTVEITASVSARLESEPNRATEKIRRASPYDKPYWHIERARLANSRSVPVELVVNGIAVERTEILADGKPQPVGFRHAVAKSSWVALRVYPSSHTNPIFIAVGGKPVRASRESAAWCRKGVDVCWEQKRQRIRPAELEAAALHYEQARKVYDRILTECT